MVQFSFDSITWLMFHTHLCEGELLRCLWEGLVTLTARLTALRCFQDNGVVSFDGYTLLQKQNNRFFHLSLH